jgi:hypothetical protein
LLAATSKQRAASSLKIAKSNVKAKLTCYKGTDKGNTEWYSNNYNNILQIGDYLYLPAAGYRNSSNGYY